MFTITKDSSHQILSIEALGHIDRDEYKKNLEPYLLEVQQSELNLKLLLVFAGDVQQFTPTAAWQDLKLAFKYTSLFSKIAIVSDLSWMHKSCPVIDMFLPFPLKAFGLRHRSDALKWLKTSRLKKIEQGSKQVLQGNFSLNNLILNSSDYVSDVKQ